MDIETIPNSFFLQVDSNNFSTSSIAHSKQDNLPGQSHHSFQSALIPSQIFTKNITNDKKINSSIDENNQTITKNNNQNKHNTLAICSILSPSLFLHDEIQLLGALSMTSEGVVRMCSAIYSISLGYFPSACDQVSFQKSMNSVNLRFTSIPSKKAHPATDLVQLLSPLPVALVLIELLQANDKLMNSISDEIASLPISKQFLENKDKEFKSFNEYCFNYIRSQQSEISPLYSYAIGRVNLGLRDTDFQNAGYSIGFLELLGIDQDSLAQIQLRNKRMDLISNKDYLLEQSLEGLFSRSRLKSNIDSAFEIVTFDGFPIKISQSVKKIKKPKQFNGILKSHNEYAFILTEIDVDMVDLQNLIQYRQKLISKNSSSEEQSQSSSFPLPIDTFIQKELSFKFEDIEYSILSEEFIDKYYSENVQKLQEIELYKKQQSSKKCGFRFIN